MSPKSEMLALGVRGARHKRDLLARKAKHNPFFINAASQQDDVVQAHLRQFKSSLIKQNHE